MRRILCLIFLIWLVGGASAQTYPTHTELFVNDFAALLPEDVETRIRGHLKEVRDKRGLEFTVVTIQSIQDYGHSGAIEPFATGLFNAWGIGNATRNDGVMMLIAVEDRDMRLEVGSGYGDAMNLEMRIIIDDVMLPEFRRDAYVLGIEKGVEEVIRAVTGEWPGNIDASGGQKALNNIQRFVDQLGLWLLGALVPIAAGGALYYRRWRRNKPRICPVEGAKMIRLDEVWDDNHLQAGQIAEEKLKSVDYDVWHCGACDHVTIEGYKSWFSSYGACRSCGYRTVEGDSTILESATTSSSGSKRVDYFCHHCKDEWYAIRTIPRKTSSSSSSGSSSFGGGSSSGGGASGSW